MSSGTTARRRVAFSRVAAHQSPLAPLASAQRQQEGAGGQAVHLQGRRHFRRDYAGLHALHGGQQRRLWSAEAAQQRHKAPPRVRCCRRGETSWDRRGRLFVFSPPFSFLFSLAACGSLPAAVHLHQPPPFSFPLSTPPLFSAPSPPSPSSFISILPLLCAASPSRARTPKPRQTPPWAISKRQSRPAVVLVPPPPVKRRPAAIHKGVSTKTIGRTGGGTLPTSITCQRQRAGHTRHAAQLPPAPGLLPTRRSRTPGRCRRGARRSSRQRCRSAPR